MMNIRKYALIATILVTVTSASSCGIYGKYTSDTDQLAGTLDIPSYRDIFKDPCLVELIDTALSRNLDLKMAHERVNQAEAQFKSAKLAYLPRLFAGGSPAVTFANPSAITYTFGTASWEIDIFGRITNNKRIAKAYRDQMMDFEQAARTELIASVATLYYNLQMLDAQIAATDTAERNWEKSVSAMRDMKEAGLADEAGVSQFEGSYYATRASGKTLRYLRSSTERAMRLLLCSKDCEIARSVISPATSPRIDTVAIGKIDLNAVRIRPDVRAAEMQLAQSFYNVNLARANCCPSISLGGTIGMFDRGLIYNAVGNLLQPIFNAGENISKLKVSKSRYEEAKMAYANVLLTAGKEVADAIAGINSYQDKIEDCNKRVEAMTRALDATQLKMKFGRGTYLEVLTAQNNLIDAQITELQNTADLMTSLVSLYQSLGGGR